MATTVSSIPGGRPTWTNDSGTPAVPVGNGTQINNARLQADVYDVIDSLLAGNLLIGGTIGAQGFGSHTISAGGAGPNALTVRNTTAGTGNKGVAQAQADGAGVLALEMFSTTHTPNGSGSITAAGGRLVLSGAGHLGIETVTGEVRFFPAGALRARVDFTNGLLASNDYGLRILNTGATAIDGVIVTSGNEMRIGSDSAAAMVDTVIKAGAALRFRTNSSERVVISSAGQTQLSDGSAAVPGLSFISDTNMGLYRSGTDELSIATAGTQRMRWASAGNCELMVGQHLAPIGSASAPSYSFTTGADNGMFVTIGPPDRIRFAADGLYVAEIYAGGIATAQNHATANTISATGGTLGTGAKRGGSLFAGYNSSGNGAAGAIALMDRLGNNGALWIESGNLRISIPGAAPMEDDSVSHTSGVVVGTQTSSRDSKDVIAPYVDLRGALRAVLATPLYRWRYKQGRGIQGEEFMGIITDESPLFGMDRDADHPGGKSLNLANAIGLLVAAVQAQQIEIAALRKVA